MSRITGTDAFNMMEAYNAVYAPQELTEEQVWEEVEAWVNSLVEEGYDLSEYTWEDMYEEYLSEAIGQPGSAGMVNWKDRNTGAVRSGYKSSSDGKLYKNYNDALAARNSRLRSAQQPGTSATMNALNRPGVQNRFIQDRPTTQAPTRPTAAPARPAAAPARPVAQAPAKPAAAPTGGVAKPTTTATTAPAATPAAPARTFNPLMQRTFGYQTGYAPSQVKGDIKKMAIMGSLRNSFDPFDIVKGYLIDEGYAETEEAASVIMANMSEEWKESILESGYFPTRESQMKDEAKYNLRGQAVKPRTAQTQAKPTPSNLK